MRKIGYDLWELDSGDFISYRLPNGACVYIDADGVIEVYREGEPKDDILFRLDTTAEPV